MIDKLYKPFPFRINSVGVNPSDVPTILELLNDYYNKINDTIDLSNSNAETVQKLDISVREFMEHASSVQIPNEVKDLLNLWYQDGTLEQLLNTQTLERIRKELQQNIDNNKIETGKQIDDINSSLDTNASEINSLELNKASKQELELVDTRIDNIIAMPPSIDNAETSDIRLGADGVTYKSAGDSVRTQFTNLTNVVKNETPTNNATINSMIREIYIRGNINPAIKYKVRNIFHSTEYRVEIEDETGIIVAGIVSNTKPDDICYIPAVNSSGIDCYLVVDWSKVDSTGVFNLTGKELNSKCFYRKSNTTLDFYLSVGENGFTDSTLQNQAIKELYLTGLNESEKYKILNFYISGERHVINIANESGTKVATYDSSIGYNDTVLKLSEVSSSGVSGYIVLDWSKIRQDVKNANLSYKVKNINNSPLIYNYLMDMQNDFTKTPSQKQGIKELYLTGLNESETYKILNFYISGERHVINVTKSDGTIVTSYDSSVGYNNTVLKLSEKNGSGINGYIVVDWSKINLAIRDDIITYKARNVNNSPLIYCYLTTQNLNIPQKTSQLINDSNFATLKEVEDMVPDLVTTISTGVYKNAYNYGFKPGNSASENVVAMQNALNGGGTIIVDVAGDYRVNDKMLIENDTTLMFCSNVRISVEKKGETYPPFIFINEGAFSRNTNKNINVFGYHVVTNGVGTAPTIDGLRGYLSLYHVKNVIVRDIKCDFYPAHVFFLHICDFENVTVENFRIIGDKDAIHTSKGKHLTIRNGEICSVDDSIALNAWDFYESNPEIGDIEDVLIENVVELDHSYNPQSHYSATVGYSVRMLGGCWTNWTQGMSVQHSTTVINNGNMYRVSNLVDGTAISNTPPTHTSGSAYIDGIQWIWKGATTKLGSRCKNVTIRNYTSRQIKAAGNFSINAINEVNHKSYYTGATHIPHENIVIDNVKIYGYTQHMIDLRGDLKDLSIINSYINFDNVRYSLITMYDLFGINNYTKPYVSLINNVFDGLQYVKITGTYSANRTIDLKMDNNKSQATSFIKTKETTFLTADKCDISSNYTDRALLT